MFTTSSATLHRRAPASSSHRQNSTRSWIWQHWATPGFLSISNLSAITSTGFVGIIAGRFDADHAILVGGSAVTDGWGSVGRPVLGALIIATVTDMLPLVGASTGMQIPKRS
jgi:hypothetical protein